MGKKKDKEKEKDRERAKAEADQQEDANAIARVFSKGAAGAGPRARGARAPGNMGSREAADATSQARTDGRGPQT
jgi:hypothetical protein